MTLEALEATLESDHFPRDGAIVRALSWDGALGRSYRGSLEAEIQVPDFDAQVLLGSDLRVVLARGHEASRALSGLVWSVRELRTVQHGVHVSLDIAPAFELLSLRHRSRIFQNKKVPEIVAEVLSAELGTYGRSFSDETSGTYPTREYCVQYQESDRDFVQRLLEEEGIWISFDHAGDVETLVLRDENASAPRAEAGDGGIISYRERGDDFEHVHFARLATRSTATSVATRHFDWTNVANREATDEGTDGAPHAESYEHGHGFTLTLADFSGRYGSHDAAQRARVWREELASRRIRLFGRANAIGLDAGLLFDLVDHPVSEANGEHLLTRVVHELRGSGEAEGRVALDYQVRFEAQPSDRPFRPRRMTPRPVVSSIETAIVVGPAGEEIHTDEHGRIKVQFHWDRDGQSDENSSCWLRCAQNWAGEGWGFVWTPRMGMEVIVRFEEGDPDRPLATGALYTGANTPPYPLPAEKTKSTIKSNSSIGGGGFNELRFEDKAGSEEIFQHAQKDLDEKVLNDHSTDVGANQKNEVDGNQTQIVHGDQTETIGTTQDLVVGGNRKVKVDGGFKEKVVGKQTRLVKSGSTESISDHEHHEVISGGVLELITGKETRTVSGGLTETLHDHHAQLVTGAVTETVSGTFYREGSTLLHDATASISMTGTAGIDMNGNVGIRIRSPNYRKLTARRGDTGADETITSPTKWEAFLVMAEASGLKVEGYRFKLDVTASKYDLSGSSVGFYGLTVSVSGRKADNDVAEGLEMKGTFFKCLAKGKYKKDLG